MPTTTPMPTKNPGDVLTSTLWNSYLRDNIDKLLTRGHRVLTVAQFGALSSPEGTKGTVAPDEVYLEVDSTNGIQWHLAYESGETTYKWRFIGGPPLFSEVTTEEATSSTAYVALATAGPSIALPRSGDYDVDVGAGMRTDQLNSTIYASYDIGGTGAVDADAYACATTTNGRIGGAGTRMRRKQGLTAVTLTAKYRHDTAASTNIGRRLLRVTPVRLI